MNVVGAVSGFVFIILSVSVAQRPDGWTVTYIPNQICALKGSTVDIMCSFRYPPRINESNTTVEQKFWYVDLHQKQPVDLRTESKYAGRVQYWCTENKCNLRITNLRESDSALYKFRFITNQPRGSYTGFPGVNLSVTGLDVQIRKSSRCLFQACTSVEMECRSTCVSSTSTYIWKTDGKNTKGKELHQDYFSSTAGISCALEGYEAFPSSTVCVPSEPCNKMTYSERSICAFKGSTINISCIYSSSTDNIKSKSWFRHSQTSTQPIDLREYQRERVAFLSTMGGHATLMIRDLTESDSAEYRFRIAAPRQEWTSNLPGTTLTVKDPDIQVQVIWSPSGPKLICHSSCLHIGHSSFVWFENEVKIQNETSFSYGGNIDQAESYSCAYQGYRSTPVYAPGVPRLLINNTGDIMKDSSVSLTCMSDAHPAAKYAWYKKNQTMLGKDPQLVFSSIQPSDTGDYYCTAENTLGKISAFVSINVKYGPGTSTLSTHPSGEIVEGVSVTLTCSSNANPSATYTWYKDNQTLATRPEGIYHFASIRSEDRGIYYCKSENPFGWTKSKSLFLNVQYAPKLPSVSVSPSGEITEGRSVNLTCSSDANPAANYTWYKVNQDSPMALRPTLTIPDFRPENGGYYYCEAQNIQGRHNSTSHLIVVAASWQSAAVGTITAVFLFLIPLTIYLWNRKHKQLTEQSKSEERPSNSAQITMAPVHDTPSAEGDEPEGDIQYSTIRFSEDQNNVLYTNIRQTPLHRQAEEEESGSEYATINFDNSSATTRAKKNRK